jgi:CRP-like cAMP-binding protein
MYSDVSSFRANELFSGLTESEVEDVVALGETITVSRDTNVCREGEEAQNVFLVVAGQIVLRKNLDVPDFNVHRETPVGVCHPGQLIGWSALVEPYVYTLTATSERESTLLKLPGREVQRFLGDRPELGYKVMNALANIISRRLRQIEEALITERALVIEEAREHSR